MEDHRLKHPKYVDGCYTCKVKSMSFGVPPDFRSIGRGQGTTDDISSYSQNKLDMEKALREDKEGVLQRVY